MGRGKGEIDDAIVGDGPAVVDAHEDALAIAEVCHTDPASEGKAAMRAGERVHVEVLPRGSFMALELEAIPGGLTSLQPVPQFGTGGEGGGV